jgi:large subunit ribosomal protein L3
MAMSTGILGRKVGMTQIFDERGSLMGVTVIEAGSCRVLRVRTLEKDGYRAVQLGYGTRRRPIKPDKGQVPEGAPVPAFVREVRLAADAPDPAVGEAVPVTVFGVGDRVDVTGISRGRGFQGGVRRHHFGRGPMAHGSKYHRGPGSLSARTSGGGGRVHPGRKMPGHLGAVRRTVQDLEVVRVDEGRGLILVKGSVPGARGGYVVVRPSVKARAKGGRRA